MKLILNTWIYRVSILVLFSIVAAFLLGPISSNTTFPSIVDTYNHLAAIIQAKMAFAEGQFPLRIAPLEHNGWRYPFYQFYSPSTYAFAGLIYQWLTPLNPYIAYKMTIWCALVVGGIYMYRLANWLVDLRIAAILAGVAYIASPYNFILIDHIGAFNEVVAVGILPLILFYTFQVYFNPSVKNFLITSLSWYLLATVHLATFFYSSLFIALLLCCITVKNFQWKNLIYIGIAYAFGCILALWHLAPIATIGKDLLVGRTFNNINDFYNASPGIASLISPAVNISNRWGTPDETVNIISFIHPAIGMPFLFAILACIYAVIMKTSSGNKRADFFVAPLIMLFLIIFVCIWSPINFWEWLPTPFMIIQYSWRLMGQLMWVGGLLFAWMLCWLFKNKLDARHLVLGILLLVMSSSVWAPNNEVSYVKFDQFLKKPVLQLNLSSYILDARKHSEFITAMDSRMLDELMMQKGSEFYLHSNVSAVLSQAFVKFANNPVVILKAKIPDNVTNNVRLVAFINGKAVAIKKLSAGKLVWEIPLSKLKSENNKSKLSLLFKLEGPGVSSDMTLQIESIVLGGFYDPLKIMNVEQTQTHCAQQDESLLCTLKVPENIRIVELPADYYPDYLNVKINGKRVHYMSVLHESQVIAAVIPEPGKLNTIEIKFTGLLWANYLSSAAWQLWLLLLTYILLRHIFYKARSKEVEIYSSSSP